MNANPELQEEKFAMIRRWIEGGTSQKEFCEKENVTFNNFQYWLKRFRLQNKSEIKPGFVKIPSQKSSGACYAELHLKSGNIIRFFSPLSINELKALVN